MMANLHLVSPWKDAAVGIHAELSVIENETSRSTTLPDHGGGRLSDSANLEDSPLRAGSSTLGFFPDRWWTRSPSRVFLHERAPRVEGALSSFWVPMELCG